MGFSLLEGFIKSLSMAVLSEIGDRTFCAAAMLPGALLSVVIVTSLSTVATTSSPALNHDKNLSQHMILAMRHPRRLVFAGCLVSSIAMTAISALLGWAAPSLISHNWAHHITTLLFFGYGFWSLWEGITEEGEADELAEIEEELDAVKKATSAGAKGSSEDTDKKATSGGAKGRVQGEEDLKKQNRPFLMQFFSPIFIKAFSITFFGEWGDKSQIATIGLASDENPFGVVLGGIVGQALCIIAAVIGGKGLATKISERLVALSSGVLFLIFGAQSLLSPTGE